MARNHLAACLVATLALGACGGAKQHAADDVAAKKVAALRAHNDSVRTARAATAAADSVAKVRFASCSDSVTAILAKAPVAKKGAARPDVAAVCGNQPVTTTLAAATVHPDTANAAAAPAVSAPAPAPAADSMQGAAAETVHADSLNKVHETEVQRETFAYAGGTRDPFASLITVTSAGPEISDLQLVGVYMDLRNDANTVAILREKVSSKRHKVRVGDRIGRLRVKDIRPRDVVFQVEDFGFERQETLSLRKQEDVTP